MRNWCLCQICTCGLFVCTDGIAVHMEPQGFMNILTYLAPRRSIWKNIQNMAVFFHLRALSQSKDFKHTVVKWKE
uniref:Stabilizer of axonemal microtubules 2 n=1 Tax=Mus musculus TaxID=10090 RepID=A0A140LJG3_MOUSE